VATVRRKFLNVAWVLLGGVISALACSGSKFSGRDSEPTESTRHDGGQAGTGEITAAGVSGDRGSTSLLPGAGAAGEPSGAAGVNAGGVGGFGDGSACAALDGVEFENHCYVDVSVESMNQVEASAACIALGQRAGRAAALLMLNSSEEQAFVIATFLSETTDAWLALSCSATLHANMSDCFCTSCDEALLSEKRAAWLWPDGSSSSFGWSGKNPDGEGRCSALAFNNSNDRWGWVDRVCSSTSHQVEAYPAHSYRVVCEIP